MWHWTICTIVSCALAVVALAQPPTPAVTGPVRAMRPVDERFVTAFLRSPQLTTLLVPRVTVALSTDGVTWTDAMFPTLRATGPSAGVAVCGSADGQKLSVFLTTGGVIEAVEGVLANGVVSWSPAKWLSGSVPDSAPSCAYMPDGLRLVVYRTGRSVIGYLYDGGDVFFNASTPIYDNSSVDGRPVVTVVGGKAIVAWRHLGCGKVDLAQGEYVAHGSLKYFDFTYGGYELGLDDSHTVNCTTEDPALGSDDSRFYVAVIQEQHSTGGLHGWNTIVYKSLESDLNSGLEVLPWTISCGSRSQSNLNIALKEDNTILAAAVLRAHDASGPVSCLWKPTIAGNVSWQDTGRSPFLDKTDVLYMSQFAVNRIGPRWVPDFPWKRLTAPRPGIH